MTISGELRNLEKVQSRLIRFCKYLDSQSNYNNYDDLSIKISSIIGYIDEALQFDEK